MKQSEECESELLIEMAYTRKEFMQTFPAVAGKFPFEILNNTILLKGSKQQLLITLGEDQQRQIASLFIPKIMISFVFTGYSCAEKAIFWQRFKLHYHKGGG